MSFGLQRKAELAAFHPLVLLDGSHLKLSRSLRVVKRLLLARSSRHMDGLGLVVVLCRKLDDTLIVLSDLNQVIDLGGRGRVLEVLLPSTAERGIQS